MKKNNMTSAQKRYNQDLDKRVRIPHKKWILTLKYTREND